MAERPQSKGWSPLKIALLAVPVLGFWLLLFVGAYVFKGGPMHESRDLTFAEFSAAVSEGRLAPWPDGPTRVQLTSKQEKPQSPADLTGYFYSGTFGDSPVYFFTVRLSTPEELGAFHALADGQKLEVRTIADGRILSP